MKAWLMLGCAITRKRECAQKHSADAALCSDTSWQMRANLHWQKCLKAGEYW